MGPPNLEGEKGMLQLGDLIHWGGSLGASFGERSESEGPPGRVYRWALFLWPRLAFLAGGGLISAPSLVRGL